MKHCRTATSANLVLSGRRALLKTLTVSHLIKKFLASYGAKIFVIVF